MNLNEVSKMKSHDKTLISLFAEHRGKVSDKWSIYLAEYDRLFQAYRDRPVRLLEIGIQNGGSLEIWSKFFSKAEKLVGCDINPDCAQLQFDDPKIAVIVADANTDEAQQHILAHSSKFDLIIDDGSHHSGDIVRSFARYFTHLNDGGLYVAEDLHCSYWQDFEGGIFQPYSSIAFFKRLADTINHEHWGIDKTRCELLRSFNRKYNTRLDEITLAHIHSIEFTNSMCVIRKAKPTDNILGRRFVAGTIALVDGAPLPLHGSNSLQPNQSENQWATRDAPVEEELTVRIQEIASLNQDVSERNGEITSINQANAEREQAHLAQLALAQLQLETHLLEQAEREKTYSQQLQDIQQTHEQQKTEQGRQHAEREQAQLAQLALTRQQLETHLLELAEREKAYSQQLQEIQQQADAEKTELSQQHQAHLQEMQRQQAEHEWLTAERIHTLNQELHRLQADNATREHAHADIVVSLQKELTTLLRMQAQREQETAAQLLAIQQRANTEKTELSQQHQAHLQEIQRQQEEHEWLTAESIHTLNQELHRLQADNATREQSHADTVASLQKELTALLRMQAQREQEMAAQLLTIQQRAEQEKAEQARSHSEQAQALQSKYAEREQALSQQLQAGQQDLRYIEQARTDMQRQFTEREQAYLVQLTLAQQQLEAQLLELVEREKAFSQQLQEIQQTHEQQKTEQNRQHAEREQALNAQLYAKQDELQNLTHHLAETEKAQAQALAQLHRELNAMRATNSWRWTAPLRNLATLLGGKDLDSDKALPSTTKEPSPNAPHDTVDTHNSSPTAPTHLLQTPLSSADNRIVDMSLNQTSTMAATLDELLSYHDERFIHCAYHTLLRRAPDPEGLRYYLLRVRAGISKVEILAQIRLGAEGKSRQVKISGLDEAIKRHKLLKIPLLGTLLWLAGVRESNNILNTQIRQGLAEVNRSLAQLQKQETPYETDTQKTVNLAASLDEGSTFTYSSDPQPYDPIGDRYHAALAEISSRLKKPTNEFSTMSEKVKISILMPVYKVPLPFLEKAVESVRYQTYANWELCIVDDGSNVAELSEYLHEIARKDARIKLEIAKHNRGIAGATNAAISMATGDFVAFLDNDDMLTHDALHCIASEIQSHPNVDLVYSDECKIDEHDVPVELFTKPDWSPCMLVNCMYTGHLSVYRKSIVEQVGCMRSEYDFSQDYDLALRVSEITSKVRHVDRILYGWRMIAGSGAQGDKPYARATNTAALQDAAIRRSISGEAVAEPAANHLRVSLASMTQKVSIVIPSDNLKNIQNTIDSINANTLYKNYEIIVVTNSGLIKALLRKDLPSCVSLVPFDQEFNFSAKCNVGAKQASGDIIVFYNDDVRVVSKDWIEMILECFVHSGVGIVGPKLLYENYLIQHAGMVTGVRGLVGTAFHCLPHETNKHFGMALWLREVSLICGACLAIRSDIFEQVDGFDAINAPISHSDVDLCFRVRDAGYSCLYTPHATLIHIGHMSIGESEKKEALQPVVRKKDKSDIFLLRQWGHHTSYDPYFPPAMRDILYHDSPETWQLHADVPPAPAGGKDILLISHDLSGSGAPRIVFEMARVLRDAGHFVVVASPVDGIYREQLNAIGVPVIIDELLLRQHPSLERLARNFDLVIANTVVTWPAIKLLGEAVETFWYIHEISLLQHLLNIQPEIKDAFPLAKRVWVGSDHAAALVLPHRPDAVILKYGVKPLNDVKDILAIGRLPLSVSLFGSYEPRKGQDLAIAAFAALPPAYRSKLRLKLFGRVLDENLYHMVELAARGLHEVTIKTEIPYEQYIEELLASHAVLVASRDDTLPFVSIDALGAGKVLMCTNTTGTSSYIEHGVSGFISASPEPHAIAAMLREMIDRAPELPNIGLNGRKVFDTEFSVSAFTNSFLSACGITDSLH